MAGELKKKLNTNKHTGKNDYVAGGKTVHSCVDQQTETKLCHIETPPYPKLPLDLRFPTCPDNEDKLDDIFSPTFVPDKNSEKNNEKKIGNDFEKNSGKDSENNNGKDSEKDTGKDSKNDTRKDSEKDTGKDSEKDSGKDSGKDSVKDSGRDSGKHSEKDPGKDSVKDSGRDSGKHSGKTLEKKKEKNRKNRKHCRRRSTHHTTEIKSSKTISSPITQRYVENQHSGNKDAKVVVRIPPSLSDIPVIVVRDPLTQKLSLSLIGAEQDSVKPRPIYFKQPLYNGMFPPLFSYNNLYSPNIPPFSKIYPYEYMYGPNVGYRYDKANYFYPKRLRYYNNYRWIRDTYEDDDEDDEENNNSTNSEWEIYITV